jgi:hypothetical protein
MNQDEYADDDNESGADISEGAVKGHRHAAIYNSRQSRIMALESFDDGDDQVEITS